MRGYYRDGQLYKSINRKHKNIFKKRSKNQKEICVNDGEMGELYFVGSHL